MLLSPVKLRMNFYSNLMLVLEIYKGVEKSYNEHSPEIYKGLRLQKWIIKPVKVACRMKMNSTAWFDLISRFE